MKNNNGFTLMELMVVLAIVAILAAVAIPSYTTYVQRAARATVQADLMAAASAMERRKAQNFTYTGAAAGTTFPSISPIDAAPGAQKYDLTLVGIKSDGTKETTSPLPAGMVGYEIIAVSTSTFASSSQTESLKLNHLGQKCYKALGASVEDCNIGGSSPDPSWH